MEEIGEVIHYFGNIDVAIIKLTKNLDLEDKIHIKGDKTNFEHNVNSMEIDHEPIKEAEKGQEIGIKIPEKARKGDKVFRVEQ